MLRDVELPQPFLKRHLVASGSSRGCERGRRVRVKRTGHRAAPGDQRGAPAGQHVPSRSPPARVRTEVAGHHVGEKLGIQQPVVSCVKGCERCPGCILTTSASRAWPPRPWPGQPGPESPSAPPPALCSQAQTWGPTVSHLPALVLRFPLLRIPSRR